MAKRWTCPQCGMITHRPVVTCPRCKTLGPDADQLQLFGRPSMALDGLTRPHHANAGEAERESAEKAWKPETAKRFNNLFAWIGEMPDVFGRTTLESGQYAAQFLKDPDHVDAVNAHHRVAPMFSMLWFNGWIRPVKLDQVGNVAEAGRVVKRMDYTAWRPRDGKRGLVITRLPVRFKNDARRAGIIRAQEEQSDY